MSSAGYFLTQVRYKKDIGDQSYLIADGGMNQNFLLAQTENTFRRYQQPYVIHQTESDSEVYDSACYIAGTSCNKDDIIGQIKQGQPKVEPGDLLVFSHMGAYNASYTVSPFLSLPPATTYLVE